jgi:hypothetical protein
VYDDAALRAELRESTDVDHQWRFFVTARLVLRPKAPPSRALSRLVAERAHAGFADRLGERGFDGIRKTGTETREIDGETARVATYEALCRLPTLSVRTTGRVAVRPAADGYLLAGGAYPTAVRESDDPEVGTAVAERLDPERYGTELDALIESVR